MVDNQCVATIGKFDGLHKGHALLIQKTIALSKEKGKKSVLITFTPHPKAFFTRQPFRTILTDEEKEEMLKKCGFDKVIFFPFDKNAADTPAEKFVTETLIGKYGCGTLVIGENFRFGYKQKGNARFLSEMGIETLVLPFERQDNIKISSENIRRLIEVHNFDGANEMLGYRYFVSGEVERGKGLGRTLGFPTLNIIPPSDKLLPTDGVYTTMTHIGAAKYYGITNVGVTPTVNREIDSKSRTVETYLFDFDGSVYGEVVKVEFYHKIRDEKKFSSVDGLREQIGKDKQTAILLRASL